MSMFVSHVPFARLVDLVEGRISEAERAPISNHLDACPRCRAEVAQLERLIGLMRSDHAEDAPDHVIARAVRLFRPQHVPETPNLLQRLVAMLHFDSAQLSPAMGVRSTPDPQAPAARQLLYRTAEHDLDLRVTPAGDAWIIAGQVLSPLAGGRVELHGATGVIKSQLNDLSEFVLPPTPTGVYQLLVHLADVVVEVNDLPVGV